MAVEGRKLAFCVGLNFWKAVTRRRWQLHESKLPHVTGSHQEVTLFDGSRLEVAVDGPKFASCVRLSFYRAVTRRLESRDRK